MNLTELKRVAAQPHYYMVVSPSAVLALIARVEELEGELSCAAAGSANLKARVAALESVVNMADQMREGVRKAGVKREQALYIHVMAYDVARALLEPGK